MKYFFMALILGILVGACGGSEKPSETNTLSATDSVANLSAQTDNGDSLVQQKKNEKIVDSLMSFYQKGILQKDSSFAISQGENQGFFFISTKRMDFGKEKTYYVVHSSEGGFTGQLFNYFYIYEKNGDSWKKENVKTTDWIVNQTVLGVSFEEQDVNFDGQKDIILTVGFFSGSRSASVDMFFLRDNTNQTLAHNKSFFVGRDTYEHSTRKFKAKEKQILVSEDGGLSEKIKKLYEWKTPYELYLKKEISVFTMSESKQSQVSEKEYFLSGNPKNNTQEMPNEQAFEYFEKWGL